MKVICEVCKWSGPEEQCRKMKARNKATGEIGKVKVDACPACMDANKGPGKIRMLKEGESAVSQEKMDAFFAHKELWDSVLPVDATYFKWFSILGALQLALKHPNFKGPAAEQVKNICFQIAMRLILDIPAVDKDFIEEAGWREFGIDPDKIVKHLITPDQIEIQPG